MVFKGNAYPFGISYDAAILRLRQIRKSKGVTQMALAGKVGISQSNISDIENNKHNPTLDTLQKIADALAVPVVDLFEDDRPSRDAVLSRLMAVYHALPVEERIKVTEIAELMARRSPNQTAA